MVLNLNESQILASKQINGNLLIIASAGTGKTTTIVERFAHLIEKEKINPDQILMTTFTNKAAKDLIKKIKLRTGKEPRFVGTMHSIFLKFLRQNASILNLTSNFTIVDNSDKRKIIKNILLKEGLTGSLDEIKYFLSWVSKFKNLGIFSRNLDINASLDQIREEGIIEELQDDEFIKFNASWRKKVNKIYSLYEIDLHSKNSIDLDDVLLLTLDVLEKDKKILEYYQNKFKAIMVDEAQDINVVQIKILKLLQKDNLCLIGDDCQNIYEWRGASNDLVFDFSEKQNKIFLTDNYRSGKKIVDAINKVISSMNFKIEKNLKSTKDYSGKIIFESFMDFDEELDYLVEQIEFLIENGVKKEDIAVLFRTNRLGKEVERKLRSNKIPCHLAKSIDFFEREEIKDILSFIKLKCNPNSGVDFDRVLKLIEGVGDKKVITLSLEAEKLGISRVEALKNSKEFGFNSELSNVFTSLNEVLNDFTNNPIDQFLDFFKYRLKLRAEYARDDERLEDKLENIQVMFNLSSEYGKTKEDLVLFLDGLIELDKKEKHHDKIILSTIHSAKGLEWEHVFLVACNEGTLPFYNRELTPLKEDSELRLFYVAISRAKHSLVISNHELSSWGKREGKSHFIDIIQ